MCYEEFNRLFCKGMFKVALINTIQKLTEQNAPQSSAEASQPKPKVELDLTKMFSSANDMKGSLGAKVLEKVEDLKFY